MVNFRRYSGGIEVKSMKAGDTMSLEGDGQLIINADCTGGTIAIRGNFTVTDNASAAVTLSDEARFDVSQITGGAYSLDTDLNGRIRIVDGTGTGEINTNGGAIVTVETTTTNTDLVTAAAINSTLKASHGSGAWTTATSVTVSDKTGFKLASDGLALVTSWTIDITGAITGSLSGSVGSVSGNVGGSVASVVGAVGSVTGAVGSVAGNVDGTVASVVTKTGYALAANGLDSIVVETGLNARQALSINASASGGKLSGAATTTITILGAGVATTRILATVDEDGNRSAVTLTPPA
jgi:hypothetical protein